MTESIGARIRMLRRRRGLSQVAVAGLVGRSESWLSQVERGVRGVDSHSVLRDLARVLRVDIDVVAGSDHSSGPSAATDPDRPLLAVEHALFAVSASSGRSCVELRRSVAAAHEAYQAARYDQVLAGLPDLIHALDADGSAQLRASGYTLVAKMLTKVGADDLAATAADRAWTDARRGADPADVGMAVYQVACALIATPRTALGERLAIDSAQRLAGIDSPAVYSVTGALWLIAAVAAGRRGDRPGAETALRQAADLASALGVDANHRWTAFGPTNVAIHQVSVLVELGDAPGALAAAERISLARLPVGLRSRRTQVRLDIAWAQAKRRRDADALVALLEIERTAPEVIRHNAMARDTVRQILLRTGGFTGNSVRHLAVRSGITLP